MSRIRVLALLVTAIAAAIAVSPTSASAGFGEAAEAPDNPLAGLEFYVDKETSTWEAWQHLERTGQQAKADEIWKIAREPRNLWFGDFTRPANQFYGKVRRPIEEAKALGQVPLLTVLRALAVKCSPDYQGGGPREDALTRAWYDKFANAIGDDRVVIAFEPDSLGTVDCQARSRRDDRYRLLRYGLTRLSELPNTTVYMEAGASDWMKPHTTARKLRKVGIHVADGFMLNATHYDWTGNNIRYGAQVSRLVGGKHFIINTGYNGRGPVHYKKIPGQASRRINVWCNPGLRGLGIPPTTETHHPLVDAYLWVNRPGYGQSCAGFKIAWHLPRALEVAALGTDWLEAPSGTRLGHYKRYPLSAFNIHR